MYFAPPAQLDSTLAGLSDAGIEIGSLLASGALCIDDVDRAYLFEGALQPDVRLAGHALLVGQALRDGFDGLRVCSEIVPLLDSDAVCDQWCGYEVRADLLIARLPSIVVCACDLRQARADMVSDLQAVHSLHAGEFRGSGEDAADAAGVSFQLHADPDGLALSGEVDASSAERMGRWLREALPDLPAPVVHVEGLEFIDAAGMWALLDSAHAHPDGLHLKGASPSFRRVWSVCGYDTITSVRLN
jgi:anti-anti-sigma factor